MRIGEAANQTGLSISNIRFYERKGLLEPVREKENKYRDYTAADIMRLKQIVLYRKMDLSVEQIAQILNDAVPVTSILPGQIALLQEKQKMLEGSISLCEELLRHPVTQDSDIEFYLNYVKEEEKNGSRFADIEETLSDYASFVQYDHLIGSFFMWKPFGKYIPNHIARILWSLLILLLPLVIFVLMCIDEETPGIGGIMLFLFITFIIWAPFLSYYRRK